MEVVPFNFIDSEQMAYIGFLVLPGVGTRAFMDLAFLSSNEEDMLLEFIEVEAKSTSQPY